MSLKLVHKSLQLVSGDLKHAKTKKITRKANALAIKRQDKRKQESDDSLLKKNIKHLLQEKDNDGGVDKFQILKYCTTKKELRSATKSDKKQESAFDDDDFNFSGAMFDDNDINKKETKTTLVYARKK